MTSVVHGVTRALVVSALACGAGACADPAPLSPRIVHGLDDMPLRGADTLLVTVEQGGVALEGREVRVPLPATGFELLDVPLGRDLALRVEAFAGNVPLARGRSLPFNYPTASEVPAGPDVLVATLGRFTRTLETSLELVAVLPSARGAIVVSSSGEILSYEAHGGSDGGAVLVSLGEAPARAGARWVTLVDPSGAEALLGVGGADDGASVIDALGRLAVTLPGSGDGPRVDIALGSASDGSFAIAAGGADAHGVPSDRLARFELTGPTTLVRTELAPLGAARSHAEIALVPAEFGGEVRDAAVVAGGGASDTIELVDPRTGPRASVPLDPVLDGRAWVAVETGLLVAAGGMDAARITTDAVDLYLVRPDVEPPIARVTPTPSPLFAPRGHAVPLRLGPGLALFVSGTDDASLPVRGAELVEVRLDALPGDVVPTGSLPVEASARALARLRDHSVLVVGRGLVAAYVPPRGPD
ncbi:MAG: hypothetical protein U0353_30175 [Sandaracinus sp.]